MASPVLQELIERLGEKDGERIYNAAIAEGVVHMRKHIDAAKETAPREAGVVLAALDAVDDDVVTNRLVKAIEGSR